MPGIDTDEFMPEFWPADKILGLILDDQLEGIEASKIVGLIVNDQVASLAAAKIEGKLTQAQIETIAAEQITGKLTNEQIAEIAAAKIVGQLTDSQLGGLAAAKIIGQIASGQIKSVSATIIEGKLTSAQIEALEAAKITGKLTNAQIEALEASKITGKITSSQIQSLEAALITGQLTNVQIAALEAAKITGQITNAQIKGLETAKLTGLLTSEQIENLAVAKLIGQISESQIAAKAVTAGKINVAELSAISANMGSISAGIITGAIIRTSSKNETRMDSNGLILQAGAAFNGKSAIEYKTTPEAEENQAVIYAIKTSEVQNNLFIQAQNKEEGVAGIGLEAQTKAGATGSAIAIVVGVGGTSIQRTLLTTKEESYFLQLGSNRKERDFGLVTELPKSPVKGDRCQFIADEAKGVVWNLVYDATSKYWWNVGSSPIYNEVNKQEGTTSAAYTNLTTKGPELTFPLSGDYMLLIGASLWNTTANCHSRMGISINGAEPTVELDCNQPTAGAFSATFSSRSFPLTGMVAKQTALAKYRQISGGEAAFVGRLITLVPIRVK